MDEKTFTKNWIIERSRTLPELISRAQQVDPKFAESLRGKALIWSKSAAGMVVLPIVTWLSTKYALHWDSDTCQIVTGGVLAISAYGLRAITRAPIKGLFRIPKILPTAAVAPNAVVEKPAVVEPVAVVDKHAIIENPSS